MNEWWSESGEDQSQNREVLRKSFKAFGREHKLKIQHNYTHFKTVLKCKFSGVFCFPALTLSDNFLDWRCTGTSISSWKKNHHYQKKNLRYCVYMWQGFCILWLTFFKLKSESMFVTFQSSNCPCLFSEKFYLSHQCWKEILVEKDAGKLLPKLDNRS